MHTLKKLTETTETETLSSSSIHLKDRLSAKYGVYNSSAFVIHT